RSQNQDMMRDYMTRVFDGNWTWVDGDEDMPTVSLYKNLFSRDNDNVPAVDAAYRELEAGMRPYACVGCHAPDNLSKQNPLELFSYPNQALQSRHRIVRMLEQ